MRARQALGRRVRLPLASREVLQPGADEYCVIVLKGDEPAVSEDMLSDGR